jgi:hypothetical protein
MRLLTKPAAGAQPAAGGRPPSLQDRAAATRDRVLAAAQRAGVQDGDPSYPLVVMLAELPHHIAEAAEAATRGVVEQVAQQATAAGAAAERAEKVSLRLEVQHEQRDRNHAALAMHLREAIRAEVGTVKDAARSIPDGVAAGVRAGTRREVALVATGAAAGAALALIAVTVGHLT